jgi:WD40 repeat protein
MIGRLVASKRARWSFAAGLVAVLAVAAAVGVRGPSPKPSLPVLTRLKKAGSVLSPLAFSPDGATVALREMREAYGSVGYWGVALWDVPAGKARAEVRLGLAPMDAVFSPDGRRLVVATLGKLQRSTELVVIDTATGAVVTRSDVDRPALLDMGFSPDGSTVRATAWDRGLRPPAAVPWEFRSWDAATWKEGPRRPLAVPDAQIAAFSPDARALATDHYQRPSLTLRDLATGSARPLTDPAARKSTSHALEFLGDGATLAVGKWDGTLELWDVPAGRIRSTLRGHSPGFGVFSLGRVGGSAGPGLVSIAIERPRPSNVPRPVADLMSLFVPRPSVSTSRSEVVVWDLAAGLPRAVLPGHWGLTVSPDGRRLATSEGGVVTLWDLSRPGPAGPIRSRP